MKIIFTSKKLPFYRQLKLKLIKENRGEKKLLEILLQDYSASTDVILPFSTCTCLDLNMLNQIFSVFYVFNKRN